MLLNRRAMLHASVGAAVLSVTGCNHTKTVVVFKNQLPVALSVNASAGGKTFKKNNIQPGGSSSQTYTSNDSSGSKTPITGTVTPAGGPAIDLSLFSLKLTFGKTNTITAALVGSTPYVTIAVS